MSRRAHVDFGGFLVRMLKMCAHDTRAKLLVQCACSYNNIMSTVVTWLHVHIQSRSEFPIPSFAHAQSSAILAKKILGSGTETGSHGPLYEHAHYVQKFHLPIDCLHVAHHQPAIIQDGC